MSELALLGGPKAVQTDPGNTFSWPIVNQEMEEKVLEVLRKGSMSSMDITREFEKGFAKWHGVEYGLSHSTGTASLQCAMFGLGVGCGDEIICPSITYWASCLQALSLGASVVFADVDPETLNVDPDDIEKRITPRTKLIVVVHYVGRPADMDRIMAIAKQHNLKVLEDVSHAHGALYKGKMAGTFGDAAGFSLMSGKSFATGEAGMLLTNNREVYERAILFGHYARHGDIKDPVLAAGSGLPWGGYKYRSNQFCSAIGLEQLKKYPAEMAEIDKAMNYFWDQLEGVPGIRGHRTQPGGDTTMGGWYNPLGHYAPEELEGLSIARFAEAVNAEGGKCSPGCNKPLHMHPLFSEIDVYNCGKPTNAANIPDGEFVRPDSVRLPVAEALQERICVVPWFKHFRKDIIEQYAAAYRKAAENYKELLPGDKGNPENSGGQWGLSASLKGS